MRPRLTAATFAPENLVLLARFDGVVDGAPAVSAAGRNYAPQVAVAVAVVVVLLTPELLVVAFLPWLVVLLVLAWLSSGRGLAALALLRRGGRGRGRPERAAAQVTTFRIAPGGGGAVGVSFRTRGAAPRCGEAVHVTGFLLGRRLRCLWLENRTTGARSLASGLTVLLVGTVVVLLTLLGAVL